MRELARDAPQQEALKPGQAPSSDDDQIGSLLLRDFEDRLGRIALPGVRFELDPFRVELPTRLLLAALTLFRLASAYSGRAPNVDQVR